MKFLWLSVQLPVLFFILLAMEGFLCGLLYDRVMDDVMKDGKEGGDPVVAMSVVFWDLEGPSCRKGYNNISEDFVDATYHCANIRHTKESRLKFDGHEYVHFDGATPMLCMKTCVMRESRAMNDKSNGFDEDRTWALFARGFTRSGGAESTEKLIRSLMECERRHPTEFPKTYKNCTDTAAFWRCIGKVMHDCKSSNT